MTDIEQFKAAIQAAGGLEQYHRVFTSNIHKQRSLDHNSLQTPLSYLTERELLAGRPRGEWAAIRCPVHKSGAEDHPSMRVSLIDGHFKCMACGAKGGDLVALHRLITGQGFNDAVRDLGGRFHD